MFHRTLVVAALFAAGLPAVADPPTPSRAAQLVEQLGSDDFAAREAANQELAALGAAAFAEVRAGCLSADPEVASRARDLAHRIGRRLDNEKALAPTMVDLTAADAPLDAVLADLSKQSGYGVVLGGHKADELAAKKVTVKTGRVAFWDAVRAVNDAAGLQIASVGGFTAPGTVPYAYRSPGGGLTLNRAQQLGVDRPVPLPGPIAGQLEAAKRAGPRTAPSPNSAVVLEARDGWRRRPSAVYGAVCVEAFAPAAATSPDAATTLLQLWPEPKLTWRETRTVKVTRAADEAMRPLRTLHVPPSPNSPTQVIRGNMQVQVFQNANGVVVLNGGGFDAPQTRPGGFAANVRQSLVKFVPADKSSAVLKEFTGSVFGVIRSPTKAIVSADLEGGKAVTATGSAAVSLSATLRPKDGTIGPRLEVELAYDSNAVQPVTATEVLAGAKPAAAFGNQTIYGVRVADANGNPFAPSLYSVTSRFDNTSRRIAYGLKMHLEPAMLGAAVGEPATVAFWGTSDKTVEVPFDLRDAPLVAGKK